MSDIWIKTSSTGTVKWRKALKIHIKRFTTGTTKWFPAKVIWIKNTSTGWLRVWPTSGVFAITDPYITTTSSGSTPLNAVDNIPIRIGTTYYGRNGTWDPNGFTISSYTYTWQYYSEAANQAGDYDLLGNIGTGTYTSPSNALTISSSSTASLVDGKYISFKITANASNALYSNSADSKDSYGKIKVVRRTPQNISYNITGQAAVGSTLSWSSSWNTTEAYKPDATRTTMKWYYVDDLTNFYSGGSRVEITRASGLYSLTIQPSDNLLGKYIVGEETVFNTGSDFDLGDNVVVNGQNQVTAVTSAVGVLLALSNGRVHDLYDNNGLDNRQDIPVGSYAKFKATATGVDSNTSYRIRYRVFNWQNLTYHNVSTGSIGAASAVWTTYTADGTGSGNISSVVISGSTAEISDSLLISDLYFGSTTYSGGQKRWQIEVEITAIKTGGTRVFLTNPYDAYYLSNGSNSTISVNPTSISPGGSTTISGSFTGFPAGNAYPRQYKVNYGDGTDSGWLPVAEYANGTANPTYSLSKIYSTAGSYTATVTTIPHYASNTATTTVSTQPSAFTYTITNESSVTAASTPTQTRVSSTSNLVLVEFASSKPADTDSYTLNISGAGAAAYTTNNNTAVNQSITSVNGYDANGSSSGSGTYEWVTAISSGATTSKAIDLFVVANGVRRTFNANVSGTTNASSWAINFSWSGASANSVTTYSNGTGTLSSATSGTVTVNTNSMPIKIAEITGSSNPTITINSITAYGSTNQGGSTRAGTAGTTTSLSSVARPTSTSGTSSANYIFYSTDPQEFTINNVTKTDGSATTTPTINTLTFTESTKRVDFTYSATNAAKYRTLAFGTAFNPDTTGTASPSRGPFPTTSASDFWNYDEGGNVTVGVAATTAVGSASVSWGASTNAQSYKVSYTLGGVAGTSSVLTTTSFSINTYSGNTQQAFVLTGVTAYKNNDGTGTSKAGTLPTTTSVTPTETYSEYGTSSITVTAFVTPAPTVPGSFVFSRNLNGGTSTTRRNWFWNVSSGIGSRSYVIYDLYWWNQTTEPTTTGTTGSTTFLTFGSSTNSAPVSNANTFNFSGTSTALPPTNTSWRTMARGSSYSGDNSNTIPTGSAASWAKARCRVIATNGQTYTSDWTLYR
jgi:hypothetical protein